MAEVSFISLSFYFRDETLLMRQLIIQISIKFIYCDGHFVLLAIHFKFSKYYVFNSYRTLDLILYTRGKHQTYYSEQGNSKA